MWSAPDRKGPEGDSAFFLPKENALPAVFNAERCESGIGGAAMSYEPLALEFELSSSGRSVDEGKVDVELKRADDDE